MWSYPHLYKDQGKKRGGDGKELCDLLVVFGEHLLIFSDKDIELREDADTAIAWSRWYRKAVLDSAGQVFGAERWLREHPDRVFTDPKSKLLQISETVEISATHPPRLGPRSLTGSS
jgi:hypothetical protein